MKTSLNLKVAMGQRTTFLKVRMAGHMIGASATRKSESTALGSDALMLVVREKEYQIWCPNFVKKSLLYG